MTTRTPFLLVGDGPGEPTGLARIARDLAARLALMEQIEFIQVGGTVPPIWRSWENYPLDRSDDWGASCAAEIYRERFGRQPGILFAVWDPGRLLPYAQLDLPVQRWCYTAVDAENIRGTLGGPAQAALRAFDRVLAYGRWASRVVKDTVGQPISYLPHGIDSAVWAQREPAWAEAALGPYHRPSDLVIGCVMTNQFRKDHATFFELIATLRRRGLPVFGWLHTDVAVKDWSIPELVTVYGLEKHVRVSTDVLDDWQLSALYHASDLLVLPSLGEGFGYPIVEGLAAGRIVIHGDCAGGAELVPRTEWRVPVRTTRVEGIYALRRPVWKVEDWANAVQRALQWREDVGRHVAEEYCRGAVAHLDWQQLWPRWASWIRSSL